MKPLSILNGVVDRRLSETIEKYAFLNGFVNCSMEEYLSRTGTRQEQSTLIFLDIKGIEKYGTDVVNILYMNHTLVFVPTCLEELRGIREKYGCFHEIGEYPFSMNAFCSYLVRYIGEQQLADRVYAYGRLQIDCRRREVCLEGKRLEISGFEYDILRMLVTHLGCVFSRKQINDCLPPRRRVTGRNVDTHIKNLRRQIGNTEMIRCMRSVGYYIPADYFYQEMYQKRAWA